MTNYGTLDSRTIVRKAPRSKITLLLSVGCVVAMATIGLTILAALSKDIDDSVVQITLVGMRTFELPLGTVTVLLKCL